MDIHKFYNSKIFKFLVFGIAGLIVILLILKAGILIGFKKASFSYKWGENYHRNFAGPRGGFFRDFARDFSGKDFIAGHGVFGQIIKIDGSTLIIKGRDNVEKIVLVKDDTTIRNPKGVLQVSDLKVDDFIVIIGEPNESGQIEAKLIRVMPVPPAAPPQSFSPFLHRPPLL